jgi:hypothetical protein
MATAIVTLKAFVCSPGSAAQTDLLAAQKHSDRTEAQL